MKISKSKIWVCNLCGDGTKPCIFIAPDVGEKPGYCALDCRTPKWREISYKKFVNDFMSGK